MANHDLITVFGATGNQGGSVVRALLSLSSPPRIRAITRDTSKPAAKALASQGVELVAANLNDAASLEHAVKGATAVFAVTNYWESTDPEAEKKQGYAIADACVAAGVKHMIWSSLPHVTEMTHGKFKGVEHFDSKAAVETYIEGVKSTSNMLTSYVMPAFFMTNIKQQIITSSDGTPEWLLPMRAKEAMLPLIDIAADMGKYVVGCMMAGKTADGMRVHAVSEWTTPEAVVNEISKVAEKKVVFRQVGADEFTKAQPMPERLARELTENMLLIDEFSFYGIGEEKNQAKHEKMVAAGMKLTSVREFVNKNGPWTF